MRFQPILGFILLGLALPNLAWAWTWFQNTEQQAEKHFEQEQYSDAAQLFNDAYKRGVALYKAEQYVAATEAFTKVTRPEVTLDAQYNLGNAYFQQKEYEKAINAYEQVLSEQPEHEDARHNLELAQQQLQQATDQNQSQTDDSKSNEANNSESEQQNSTPSESEQQDSAQSEQNNSDPNESNSPNTEQQSSEAQEPQSKQPESSEQTSSTLDNSEESDEAQAAAQNSDQQEAMDSEAQSTSEAQLQSENDMMADALLNRISANPQQLLQGQFYLDARNSKAKPPDKPW